MMNAQHDFETMGASYLKAQTEWKLGNSPEHWMLRYYCKGCERCTKYSTMITLNAYTDECWLTVDSLPVSDAEWYEEHGVKFNRFNNSVCSDRMPGDRKANMIKILDLVTEREQILDSVYLDIVEHIPKFLDRTEGRKPFQPQIKWIPTPNQQEILEEVD